MAHTITRTAGRSMRLFEENFRLLTRLLPELHVTDFFLLPGGDEHSGLEIEVSERSRYTTTLELSRCFEREGRLVPDLAMTVRLYHDARCAEVLGYQGCRRIPPRHAVFGNGRFLRDDKQQVNRLLNEILAYSSRCHANVVPGCASA